MSDTTLPAAVRRPIGPSPTEVAWAAQLLDFERSTRMSRVPQSVAVTIDEADGPLYVFGVLVIDMNEETIERVLFHGARLADVHRLSLVADSVCAGDVDSWGFEEVAPGRWQSADIGSHVPASPRSPVVVSCNESRCEQFGFLHTVDDVDEPARHDIFTRQSPVAAVHVYLTGQECSVEVNICDPIPLRDVQGVVELLLEARSVAAKAAVSLDDIDLTTALVTDLLPYSDALGVPLSDIIPESLPTGEAA